MAYQFLNTKVNLRLIFKEKPIFLLCFSTIFLFLLYFFNLNTKTFILAFITYSAVLFVVFKSLADSLLYSFLLTLPFTNVGKTYDILLIPKERLFSLGQSSDWVGYNLNFVVSIQDIFSFAILIYLVIFFRNILLTPSQGAKLFVLFLLFLITWISATFSLRSDIAYLFSFKSSLIFIFYLFVISTRRIKDKISNIKMILLTLLIFESVIALLQFSLGSAWGSTLEAFQGSIPFNAVDENAYYFRPYGSFNHANNLALFLVFLCMLLLDGVVSEKKRLFYKPLLTGLIVSLVATMVTLSRTAWISLAVGTVMIYWKNWPKLLQILKRNVMRLFPVLAVLFLVGLETVFPRVSNSFLSFTATGSATTRIALIKEGFESVQLYPLLGSGIGQSVLVMLNTNPKGAMYGFPSPIHFAYLDLIVERGIIVFILFSIFVVMTFQYPYMGKDRTALNFIRSGKVAIFSLLIGYLFQPFIFFELVVIISALISSIQLQNQNDRQP